MLSKRGPIPFLCPRGGTYTPAESEPHNIL
jgi:hypothetical protein